MSFYTEHSRHFAEIVSNTINAMIGADTRPDSQAEDADNPSSSKSFHVGIYFTGMVYGEYLISMDESTARHILHIEGEDTEGAREEICDAFAEILNTVVGEAIVGLRDTYQKLTFAAPRMTFGTAIYPDISCSRAKVYTESGDIECHFYLDTMRLELATSYEEVMQALVNSNKTLEKANRQLKEQQSQLIHAEKMASLGVMAAGVAHEINNPLAFVNSNFGTLESYVDTMIGLFSIYQSLEQSLSGLCAPRNLPSSQPEYQQHLDKIGEICEREDMHFIIEDTRELLEDSKGGLERIKAIIAGLKEFSHVDGSDRKPTDINNVIENTINLVWNQIKYNCELKKNLSDLPLVYANSGEISQVLANLLINASQAIDTSGEIHISSMLESDVVVLSVSDTGAGIDAENLNQIFNPFFTTKDVGKGTGLGLSISHNIIKNHGGKMEVKSEPGKGTTFKISLPLKFERPAEAAAG